jgi:hypothetical protein
MSQVWGGQRVHRMSLWTDRQRVESFTLSPFYRHLFTPAGWICGLVLLCSSHRVLFAGSSKSRLDRLQSMSRTRSYISNKSKPKEVSKRVPKLQNTPERGLIWRYGYPTHVAHLLHRIWGRRCRRRRDGSVGGFNRILFSVFRTTTRTQRQEFSNSEQKSSTVWKKNLFM